MKTFKRIIIGILAVLGLLFVLIMLIPLDDEDESTPAGQFSSNDSVVQGEGVPSGNNGQAQNQQSLPGSSIPAINTAVDAKNVTIMIYMNGSDLESQAGDASEDLSEILKSDIGNNVNVVIETLGTRRWQRYGIASSTSQIYKIKNHELVLLEDNLGQLDCTEKSTLADFISYSKNNFPADRYMLIFWDHGGGPVYGFGYNEFGDEEEGLTLDEMCWALSQNDVYFDMIGMDCCIMASLETCCALNPYCEYTLLSEDFESSLGWSYTNWMNELEKDVTLPVPVIGKYIIDSCVAANEADYERGSSTALALVNESNVAKLYATWVSFAYANENALISRNYSKVHKAKGRSFFYDWWAEDSSNVTLSDYYISDMLALTDSIGDSSDRTKALRAALYDSICYFGHSKDSNELTGLFVTLPYGDKQFYNQLKYVYSGCGFDDNYIKWLGKFVDAEGYDDYYDFGPFEDSWEGWGSYEDDDYDWSGWQDAESWCDSGVGSWCDSSTDDDSWYTDEEDDWTYDYEDDLWYLIEDDILYMYDEDSDTLYYYDEDYDMIYYYDEYDDEWYEAE